MLIASVLKNLIEDKGVTYTFISSKTGITVDAISKSLSGRRRLAADEMILICQAANIDLSELLAAEKASQGRENRKHPAGDNQQSALKRFEIMKKSYLDFIIYKEKSQDGKWSGAKCFLEHFFCKVILMAAAT